MSASVNGPWLVAGDFNSVLSDSKIHGARGVRRPYSAFRECIEDYNLLDAGFQGPFFTWKRDNLRERLDRVLMNHNTFIELGVVHLPMFKSDHSPLWVRFGSNLVNLSKPKPFKFLSAWLGHASFVDLVK